MIFAVDFDGTIVKHKYPEIGEALPGALDVLRTLLAKGHKVFLYTMRGRPRNEEDRDLLSEAVKWLEDNGVEMTRINRSPAQFSTSLKQHADLYLDDKNFGTPTRMYHGEEIFDWEAVANYLLQIGILDTSEYLKILKNF